MAQAPRGRAPVPSTLAGDDTTAGGTGTLSVASGATADIAGTLKLWPGGIVNLTGGTIRTAALDNMGGSLQFNFGTLSFSGALQVTSGQFGATNSITTGQEVIVDGATTLRTTLDLAGGTFSTGSLVNPSLLLFNSGTFNLTGDSLTVGSGGLLGSPLSLGPSQAVNVTNNVTVDATGLLIIDGGSISSGTGLTN